MTKHKDLKFGVEGPNFSWEDIRDITLYAEKLGLDSFWMPDHLVATGTRRGDSLDAWSILTALALETEEIKLASGVSDTYRRHPAQLALNAVTCDEISGQRAILGIGAGEAMNLTPFGIPFQDKIVSRTREGIEVINKLWSEKYANYKGEYYELKDAYFEPKPSAPLSREKYRPGLPLYIAAVGEQMRGVVAKYGDGWLPANLPPSTYTKFLEDIRKRAKNEGRNPEQIDPAHFTYAVISEDYDDARNAIMLPAKMMLLSRPHVLERLGYEPPSYDFEMTYELVLPHQGKEWLEKSKEVPDEAVEDAPYLYGTPEDIIEGIEEYIDAGCRNFVMNFQVPSKKLKENCRLFANEVIEYFEEQ
ncbi:hypothetical protein AKJ37_03940 [candidate division MSBL1 archaeon SCGC-AAA259I09]|uniref:Luciferase-like domain-containing protein n=1 Tax=candidate division MSBL1 archaeon SCGC-AAA259I09 TaxID=1698267 RepID=A0A133US06_9EURY|nr:hypothetical protein AKJ37_03940 [candidate division MSBL1 archaeon SCGC-AAA259I09]